MITSKTFFWIFLGSGLGGVSRIWFSQWIAQLCGDKWPWGTFIVNVSGSLLIGFLAAMTMESARWQMSPEIRHFSMAGFCGGFTTFSAFSLQTSDMIRGGQWGNSVAYVAGSVVLCLLATSLGFLLGRWGR